MKPELAHEIEVTPAFFDVDMMEIVWHGHYVKYLELARSALLGKFDYDYMAMRASGYAWPIVDMRLKYVRSATLGRPLRIRASIVEWENRLRIEYLMRDAQTGEKMNKASTTQVAVSLATGEMCFVSPPVLLQKLGVSPC
jgi:acyl-CoA thioester hydrolase